LERTAARFRRFPEVVDRFESGRYRRLFPVGRRLLLLSVRQVKPPSRAALEVCLQGRNADAPDARIAAPRLIERTPGVRAQLAAFYRAFQDDPLLCGAIRTARGLSVAGAPDSWEALVTAVFAQQVNLALAYRIRRDFAASFGPRAVFGNETYIAFPRPERVVRQRLAGLRKLGLSKAKAETVLRLAGAFQRGDLVDEELAALPDEAAISRLTEIKGIGRWSAETTLIRGLARSDVFPAGDLGVLKYVAQGLLGRDDKASETEMRHFSERWRPHRTLALVYAYAELRRLRAETAR
jgi:DNA-3-methyladenine glycosylase II